MYLSFFSPMTYLLPKSVVCLRKYTWQDFSSDLVAGVTVCLIALPLAMAFAIVRAYHRKLEYTQLSWPVLVSALAMLREEQQEREAKAGKGR
jgi:hypothetical protein